MLMRRWVPQQQETATEEGDPLTSMTTDGPKGRRGDREEEGWRRPSCGHHPPAPGFGKGGGGNSHSGGGYRVMRSGGEQRRGLHNQPLWEPRRMIGCGR